jgi:RNA binding exosome subunit
MATFSAMVSFLGAEGVRELLAEVGLALDEHKSLYVRLSKQELLNGVPVLSPIDPIRVKVKPRSFMMKGDAGVFYARLMGEAT